MHKKQPEQESNEAILASIKKEMDAPRMATSTREELRLLPHHATGTEKAVVLDVAKNSDAVQAPAMLPRDENNRQG
jgi:hypothetical protein